MVGTFGRTNRRSWCPRACSRDWGREGGGRRPGEGLPPPSRSGLILKPDWTSTGSSMVVIDWTRALRRPCQYGLEVLLGPVCWSELKVGSGTPEVP